MRGLDLKDVLEIPPPITEENKDRYLEELTKIKKPMTGLKGTLLRINLTKMYGQHRDAKTTFKLRHNSEVIIEAKICFVGYYIFIAILFEFIRYLLS